MPRFYFHLSAPDQDFPDDIGSDVSDLAAAHSIAVRLMKRVMMFSSFADCAPDLRRWTVKVTDEKRQLVFTVLFPIYFVPRGWKPVLVSGARALLRRLECEADVHRVAGEIALKSPSPDAAKAEAYFERALAVAREQQAKSWELRAAMSMARLWLDQGKRQEARDLLAPI